MTDNFEQLDEFKNLTLEEREAVMSILKEYSEKGSSEKLDNLKYEDYDEIPVGIVTFLHDKRYLGNGLIDAEGRYTIFPYWEEKLKELFPTNITTRYNTVIFTGAIGLGKTLIGVIILLYLLYRVLCLKDPYLYYGLQPIDKISISLLNITIENAKGVALDKMNQLILSSSWFMSHGEMAGITNLEYRPNKHIELIAASSNNQIIGRALLGSMEDEVNFGAMTNNVEKLKQRMLTLISQIDARMKSRFLRGDYLPTINIIISSKNSDQSFLDSYIETKKKNESKTTLIVDEPQWVVDNRKITGEWFYVGVGNKFLASELLPKDASDLLIEEYRAKGYSMLKIPSAYYENFQDNLDGALTDIAGIATASSLKYISGIRWNEIKTDSYQNPFIKDIIEVGNAKDDTIQYSDFFDLTKVSPEDKARPLYVHLDMSQGSGGKGDKTGLGGTWILGKRPKIEGQDASSEMFYKVAFNVSVKAPKGYEISFDKNRAFIRWLREQGFNIKGVSCDSFQSAQIKQQLIADGFNVDGISVDRLDTETKQCLPYAYLKSTIYDRRMIVYKKCDLLTEEVVGLERQSDGHINHPDSGTQGCFTGDTKVSLVDGRELTFLELVDEYNLGKENWVYSFNEATKKVEPKRIEKAWCTKKNAQLVEVELDNGEKLRCTPNHRFMLRDGSYKEASELKENDSLMPLYRKYPTEVVSMKNYRMYYEPIEDEWHYEHRQFTKDSEVLDEKYLVHHKNCNCKDNTPTNLLWCSKSKHQQIHKELSAGAYSDEAKAKKSNSLKAWYKENPEKAHLKNHKARIAQLGFTEESYAEYKINQKKQLDDKHKLAEARKEKSRLKQLDKENYIKSIESLYNINWSELSNNEKDSYSVKYQRLNNPETVRKIAKSISENHKLGKYTNAKKALQRQNEENKKLKELIPNIDYDEFETIFGFRYETLPSNKKPPYAVKYRRIVGKTILNHKVVNVRLLDYTEDVYDLTVADNHNFALSAGVFVHNSKDSIDSICGSLWNASLHAEEYSFEYGELLDVTLDISGESSELEFKKQVTLDFEEELKKTLSNNISNNKDIYTDFGLGKAEDIDEDSFFYVANGIVL